MADFVTAICVSKNRPRLLVNAVKLFCSQTYQDKHLIVIEAGLDATLSQDQLPESVTYMHRPNLAFNLRVDTVHALGLVERGYVAAWDDDNIFAPDYLEKRMREIVESKADLTGIAHAIFYDVNKQKFLAHANTLAHDTTYIFHHSIAKKMALGDCYLEGTYSRWWRSKECRVMQSNHASRFIGLKHDDCLTHNQETAHRWRDCKPFFDWDYQQWLPGAI